MTNKEYINSFWKEMQKGKYADKWSSIICEDNEILYYKDTHTPSEAVEDFWNDPNSEIEGKAD